MRLVLATLRVDAAGACKRFICTAGSATATEATEQAVPQAPECSSCRQSPANEQSLDMQSWVAMYSQAVDDETNGANVRAMLKRKSASARIAPTSNTFLMGATTQINANENCDFFCACEAEAHRHM